MTTVLYSKDHDQKTLRKGILPFITSLQGTTVIKTHFGEEGNTRYIKPHTIQPIADLLKKNGCDSFISDANTLYRGRRVRGTEHKQLAIDHGFGTLGIPIIIGDGEDGKDEYRVTIEGKHFHEAWIGRAYKDCQNIILINHFKGHIMAGFGGAIKNAGMGMASRRGKMAMHASVHPKVKQHICISCGACIKACDHDAIRMDEKAEIDPRSCIGCAMCISACPTRAIDVPWGAASCESLMERTAEYATAALRGKHVLCINFAVDITEGCDCRPDTDIIAADLGLIISTDPVAADKATYDLLKEKEGHDPFQKAHKVDSMTIIRHAKEMGLGTPDYSIKKI